MTAALPFPPAPRAPCERESPEVVEASANGWLRIRQGEPDTYAL